MSIKTKIRSLIDAANAKTGKGDTDLTTAVQSLVSESGGITPSGNKAITATTSTLTDIDVTNYATVSVAPTPSEAIVVTTNGDATPSSGKLLSKVTVNVPTGEARDSSDLTVSGATVNVPAGLYSSAASKSVASGTAGTPTASKGAVSNNSVTVTPSVANTTGYITGGTKTGAGVTVSASELVSGNKALTPSETAQSGIDVANFKTVSVGAISSTYVGSGVTKKAAATVAPSTSEQTVCASGVYTTGEQKVSAITPSIVGNLDASIFAASIVDAIEGKGVTVPDGTLLDGMAALIESIAAGGGGGYSFDGNPRWISSGEFTPADTITVNNLDPILFTPSVMFGDNRDAVRGRFFFMFDATKTEANAVSYTGIVNPLTVNSVVTVSNYLYLYGGEVDEYTTYSFFGGTYLSAGREYGYSSYDQIQFGSTKYKFAAAHRYCWVAFGMKGGGDV